MTFDEVDEQLTLPRYNALQRFWIKHPPSAILLAHYVGYKAPVESKVATDGDTAPGSEMSEEDMGWLIGMFGPLPVKQDKQ